MTKKLWSFKNPVKCLQALHPNYIYQVPPTSVDFKKIQVQVASEIFRVVKFSQHTRQRYFYRSWAWKMFLMSNTDNILLPRIFSAARYISSGDSHCHGCVAGSPGSHCRNVPICEDDFTAATRKYFLTMDGHVSRQKIHMCIRQMAKYMQIGQKNELEHVYLIRLDDTIDRHHLTFRKVRWVHWHWIKKV